MRARTPHTHTHTHSLFTTTKSSRFSTLLCQHTPDFADGETALVVRVSPAAFGGGHPGHRANPEAGAKSFSTSLAANAPLGPVLPLRL